MRVFFVCCCIHTRLERAGGVTFGSVVEILDTNRWVVVLGRTALAVLVCVGVRCMKAAFTDTWQAAQALLFCCS
jgi:hypothetical protein